MVQSAPLAVLLVLLGGTAARAQAVPREQRQRTHTLTGTPSASPFEVRVAPETPTVLLFDADILKRAVRVDGSRIRVVDAGERSIIVQPVGALGEGEHQELEVRFADGKVPERAVFSLVSHPSEVDTLITVVRQESLASPCPAEGRSELRGPEDLLRLGYMDSTGVRTVQMEAARDNARGLVLRSGVVYRGMGWLMFDVTVRNLQGPHPWVPTEATLRHTAHGAELRGRVVRAQQAEPAAANVSRVLVVTEEPPPDAGSIDTLELRGEDGQSLSAPIMEALAQLPKSSAPPQERKP